MPWIGMTSIVMMLTFIASRVVLFVALFFVLVDGTIEPVKTDLTLIT